MGNRRFAQVVISDDEDEAPPQRRPNPKLHSPSEENRSKQLRKRKRMKLQDDDEEEHEEHKEEEEGDKREGKDDDDNNNNNNNNKNQMQHKEKEEEPPLEEAKPIGEPIRVSGKGSSRRKHYDSFEFNGNQYTLEDPVLLVPENKGQKPYVAIIKDIAQSQNGNMMVTGQWFYRPEEAEKKDDASWQSRDTRELFYSYHRDEVHAESVMHKCVVHFVPTGKQLPNRKQHPGFIVQKVYDTVNRKLRMLTDKDYKDICSRY